MFLFEDGQVVTLKNSRYEITTTGAGATGYWGSAAHGTQSSYLIDSESIEKLKTGKITRIRIYTSMGYVETKDKYKVNNTIKRCLMLVNQPPRDS